MHKSKIAITLSIITTLTFFLLSLAQTPVLNAKTNLIAWCQLVPICEKILEASVYWRSVGLIFLALFFAMYLICLIYLIVKLIKEQNSLLTLKDASHYVYTKIRAKIANKKRAPRIEEIPYHIWQDAPLLGLYQNSLELEPVKNVGNLEIPFIKDFKVVKGVPSNFAYDELYVRKKHLIKIIENYHN